MARVDDWTGSWSSGLVRFHRSAALNACVLAPAQADLGWGG